MKGLLLKDILVITKQLKIFLIIIPIMSLLGDGSMAALAILMGSVLPMTAIAYDECCKWNELAIMMPYSKKDIIASKYLLGYVCMFGAAVLVFVVQLIMLIIGKGDFAQSINILLFSISCGLFFIAINTPILFKFGSQKGRFVFIIAMACVAASSSILRDINSVVVFTFSKHLPIFLLIVAIIINFISVLISMRIKIK